MKETVLFLCPHHAAKSVIAEAHFNRIAAKVGLPYMAVSAGTEPDEAVSPVTVALLQQEGIDVSQHQPRHVTPTLLQSAVRIISMGCAVEDLPGTVERIEFWRDVPAVSEFPEQARDTIYRHVETLVKELEMA